MSDVPIATCIHCHTLIVDYSSAIDLPGEIYCCRNCLAASWSGHNASVPDLPLCDHCECPLAEPESLVERKRPALLLLQLRARRTARGTRRRLNREYYPGAYESRH